MITSKKGDIFVDMCSELKENPKISNVQEEAFENIFKVNSMLATPQEQEDTHVKTLGS